MKRLIPILLLATCTTLGPDYERSADLDVPHAFRSDPFEGEYDSESPTFGALQWRDVFRDPALQALIEEGLENNYNIRIAVERVRAAREQLVIVRSELYPELNAAAGGQATRLTKNGPEPLPPGVDKDQESVFAGLDAFWEIDFWGRIERASEAARAELLATDHARRAVTQSMVATIAEVYYDLIELDAEMEIALRTIESRERSLRLVRLRLEQGVANKVELRQSEGLVLQSSGLVPDLARRIEQRENLLRQLLGGNPGPIERGLPLLGQELTVDVPAGLPSELLDRRPDVMLAEQRLVAANARIGEAKALLYPSIRLTGSGGVSSEHLSDLFEHDSLVWNAFAGATAPIFNAGRLEANVKATESRQRSATLFYQQTLKRAFRDVADALIAYEKSREVRGVREQFEVTLADQTRLSHLRYRGGVTSYLEVLDSERDFFDAELSLAQAVRDELFSVVFLYRSLGGGWEGTPAAEPVPDIEAEPEPVSVDDTTAAADDGE